MAKGGAVVVWYWPKRGWSWPGSGQTGLGSGHTGLGSGLVVANMCLGSDLVVAKGGLVVDW